MAIDDMINGCLLCGKAICSCHKDKGIPDFKKIIEEKRKTNEWMNCVHVKFVQHYDERRGTGNGISFCYDCGFTAKELMEKAVKEARYNDQMSEMFNS